MGSSNISDEAMSNFVERGLHYNISSIDFKAVPEDKSGLVCIDIVVVRQLPQVPPLHGISKQADGHAPHE